MGRQTICIGENKGADQLRSNCEADHAFVLATRIVQYSCRDALCVRNRGGLSLLESDSRVAMIRKRHNQKEILTPKT